MSQTVVERTVEHIAESAQKASRATCAVADAIEDGVGVVRRAAKQGVEAAEEFLNDSKSCFRVTSKLEGTLPRQQVRWDGMPKPVRIGRWIRRS